MAQFNEQQVRSAIASAWWIPFLQGVVTLLFGIYAFTRTEDTLATLLWILGLYWLWSGASNIWSTLKGQSGQSRVWELVSGGLHVAAGLFALSHPFMTGAIAASVVATIIGIVAIISGLVQIAVGRQVQAVAGAAMSRGSLFGGILNIVFGIIVIANPLFTITLFIRIIAFCAIVGGLMLISAALRLRNAV